MSKSIKLYLKSHELASAWNRKLKEFIRKGGALKDFIKRFGNGHTLTPKHRLKELLAFSPVRTVAVQSTQQRATPSMPASSLPAEAKAIPNARKLSPKRLEEIKLESRARCARIVRFGQERNCLNQACALAFETEMPVSEAVSILQNVSAVASMDGGKRHY